MLMFLYFRYATVDNLLELWESLSISNGATLLRDMGLPHRRHERISLCDLSSTMEEEGQITVDQSSSMSVTPLQMAVLTYLHEVKFLRSVSWIYCLL